MLVFLHITATGKHTGLKPSSPLVPTWDRHPDYTVLPIGKGAGQDRRAPAGVLTSFLRQDDRNGWADPPVCWGRSRGRLRAGG